MGKIRKIRNDKKIQIKAVLPLEMKDAICRLSYITNTPIKDICEILCKGRIQERSVITALSKYFQREIIYDGTMFRGHLTNPRIAKRFEGEKEVATMTLTQFDYEAVSRLAYALNVSPSRCTAILIDIAIHDVDVVNDYIKEYLQKELTQNELEDLKKLISYTNGTNINHHSWASFLGYIKSLKGSPFATIRDTILAFLDDMKNPKE